MERETAALTLELSASIAPEPADVDVRMRLERDARSRALTIEWWNADGVGGSHLIWPRWTPIVISLVPSSSSAVAWTVSLLQHTHATTEERANV